MLAVRDHLAEFGDAEIVIVSFAPPAMLAAQRKHLQVPFTFLSDPDRELYRLVGAERGRLRDVWSLGTLRTYARLLRSGRRLQRLAGDTRQLGADVVVGRDGRVRYLCLPTSPDERPPVTALIAALG